MKVCGSVQRRAAVCKGVGRGCAAVCEGVRQCTKVWGVGVPVCEGVQQFAKVCTGHHRVLGSPELSPLTSWTPVLGRPPGTCLEMSASRGTVG